MPHRKWHHGGVGHRASVELARRLDQAGDPADGDRGCLPGVALRNVDSLVDVDHDRGVDGPGGNTANLGCIDRTGNGCANLFSGVDRNRHRLLGSDRPDRGGSVVDPAHLWGDALALVGAVFSAAYVSVAERVRKTVDTSTMTFVLYAVSAVTILPLVFIFGQQLVGFDAQAWALILAVTLGAQLLGHSMMTRVLSSTSATVVSLAILFEMPGATLVAAIWLGQVPAGVAPAAA